MHIYLAIFVNELTFTLSVLGNCVPIGCHNVYSCILAYCNMAVNDVCYFEVVNGLPCKILLKHLYFFIVK